MDIDTHHFTIVARGFDKFHNYGEPCADVIDWSGKIWARQKEDGSLIKFAYDVDEKTPLWMTNNGFDANAPLSREFGNDLIGAEGIHTFQDLIDEAMKGKEMPSARLIYNFTLMFELVSPFNRIVCQYPKTELILLGARDKINGTELTPESVREQLPMLQSFRIPKAYELKSKSIEEVIEIVKAFDSNNEGIVVQDEHFNRVKVKGEQYLSIHRMLNNSGQLSYKHVFECIQNETVDDILGVFPEHTQEIRSVINKYKRIAAELDSVLHEARTYLMVVAANHEEKDRKKAYAMLVKDSPFAKVFFDIYKNPENAAAYKESYLKTMDYDRFVALYDEVK
jgi:hypothetical protein